MYHGRQYPQLQHWLMSHTIHVRGNCAWYSIRLRLTLSLIRQEALRRVLDGMPNVGIVQHAQDLVLEYAVDVVLLTLDDTNETILRWLIQDRRR